MVAYSSVDSLYQALTQGKGIYYSRSRQGLWEKGANSGHKQELISSRYDCDRDSLIFQVKQTGVACHTGADTCFGPKHYSMEGLFNVLKKRKINPPENSYTASLFANKHKLHKKVIEEAFEATQAETEEEKIWELADAVFFISMLAVEEGISWQAILNELGGRRR